MTVRAPIIGTNTDTAETFRLAMGSLWVPAATALKARTGVTSIPTLTGTGNFTATVSPFTAVVAGTSNSLQGSYPVAVDVASTITITAANTQARIDLVSLQIQDNAYDSSGFSRGQLVVTAGTPAGSPVAPSAPANSLSLWTVPVAANATSVVFSSATAVFPYTAAAGGIVPARNASDKPAAANGVQLRYRLDVTPAAGGTSPVESSVDGVTFSPIFDASAVPATTTAAITAAQGKLVVCTSSTRPGSPVAGLAILETDTGHVMVYISGTWTQIYPLVAPSWTNITLASGYTAGTPAPRYLYNTQTGTCYLEGVIHSTSGITAGSTYNIATGLPSNSNTQYFSGVAAGLGPLPMVIASGGLTIYPSVTVGSGQDIVYLGGSYVVA